MGKSTGHYPTNPGYVAFLIKSMSMKINSVKKQQFINEAILQDVLETVGNIGFGSIVLNVHNSAIVAMEITEKYRFQNIDFVEKGGGI